MSFEHSEFLVWMGVPLSILFYLWITQKPISEHPFSTSVLEKLRVKDSSLGLKGRNILFFSAAWLMILALCEPIIYGEKLESIPSAKVVVIDISSTVHFEQMKSNVIKEIASSQQEIELLAIDEQLYRIAPRTLDKALLIEFIKGLEPSTKGDELKIRAPIKISDEYILFSGLARSAHNSRNEQKLYEKIPLFYTPLGAAMILIALALSSMSKRESVSMAMLLFLFLPLKNADAGVMDFRILDRAYEAYEKEEFHNSAELFAQYQHLHDTPQVRYNRANALFKAHRYSQARFWYERVYTSDPALAAMVKWNLQRMPQQKGESKKVNPPKREKKEGQKREKRLISIRGETPLYRY